MITIRDIVNQMATAEEKGEARGLAEGKANAMRELAKSMLADGLDAPFVSKHTHLPLEDVLALQQKS